MGLRRNKSKLAAMLVMAIALSGCANSAASITNNVETAVIGEGSGSGELVTKGKETFESGVFDSIEVNTNAMEIMITKSTDDRATVELVTDKDIANRFTFAASIKSNALVVDVEEESKSFNFSANGQKGERKLLLSLPDKTYEQVKITNAFGLVDAADLKSGKVAIDLDAGAIRLNRVSGELDLQTAAGEIDVKDISLDHHLSARSDVGEIKIQLNEAPVSASVNLKSEVGKVTADLKQVDYSVSSSNEKVGTVGDGDYKLEAFSSVGAITVDTE